VKGGPPDEFSLADWNDVMSVNVTGTFLSSREAFRTMKRQGDGGRIIIVGSIAAHRSRPHSAAYASSKHAVWGLTQALAIDGREFGISVSCLQPGNTQVERRADGRAHGGRDEGSETMMPSQDIARTALLMATLAPGTNLLEATVLPIQQPYIGRG
jgi:NAD(P)-dependent dehydrogenase (short-subunit alcohol dehydrogenase family)